MSKIHIQRAHSLGLPAAREAAKLWAQKAQEKLDLHCSYQQGLQQDCIAFERSGVKGALRVSADAFELEANLGFLVSAFKSDIEAKLQKQIDDLLKPKT